MFGSGVVCLICEAFLGTEAFLDAEAGAGAFFARDLVLNAGGFLDGGESLGRMPGQYRCFLSYLGGV